jgi:hypothetical protein
MDNFKTIDMKYKKPPIGIHLIKKENKEEEYRRCKFGFEDMTGEEYFYYNYCYVINSKGERKNPTYRQLDHEQFQKVFKEYQINVLNIRKLKMRRHGFDSRRYLPVILTPEDYFDKPMIYNSNEGLDLKLIEGIIDVLNTVPHSPMGFVNEGQGFIPIAESKTFDKVVKDNRALSFRDWIVSNKYTTSNMGYVDKEKKCISLDELWKKWYEYKENLDKQDKK